MQELDTLYQLFKKEFLEILENNYKLSFHISLINRTVFTLQGKISLNNNLFIEFNTTDYRKSINYTFG